MLLIERIKQEWDTEPHAMITESDTLTPGTEKCSRLLNDCKVSTVSVESRIHDMARLVR